MAGAAVAFFSGHLRAAREAFAATERIFRHEYFGAEWERVTSHYFVVLIRLNMGELAELKRDVERGLEDAERHADVYARTLFSAQPNVWRCLAADQPELAEPEIERALAGWPKHDFFLTQLYLEMARVVLWMYVGRTQDARDLLERNRRRMRENLMDQIPYIVAEVERYRGLAALRLGDGKQAAACARRLAKLKVHCSPGIALLYRAVLVARAGERDEAGRMALRAVQMIEEAAYMAHAQAARYQLGVFLGEREGQRLRDEARAWFTAQGTKDVEKMVALLAPAFAAAGALVVV
jgi:tetratricopeptide (TPR) repeat protein